MPTALLPIDLRLADVLDIAVVAVLLYGVILAVRRARLRGVAVGLGCLALLFVVAQVAGLRLTVFLFQVGLALVGLAFIVMYHGELRTALERAAARLGPRRNAAEPPRTGPPWAEAVTGALQQMARRKVGALVVIAGRDDLGRHVSGGTPLGAHVGETLLLSIFEPHSPGHDGAAVIAGDRITSFQAHLPLSTDSAQLSRRGTRHAAALGLAERADALCLVVSEERGAVSVALDGVLRLVEDAADLQRTIEEFVTRVHGEAAPRARVWSWKSLRPQLASVVMAAVLWFVVVHEGETEFRSYQVPVELVGLDESLRVAEASPRTVRVIITGPRRAFYFVGPGAVALRASAFDLEPGRHEITLTASDVVSPNGLTFQNIFPRTVDVTIAHR